jgi:pimeloyl-ACP methyl ester carboxylesterase
VGRIVLRGALGLLALIAIVVVAAFGYRAWRQHENAQALAITTPNGIDEAAFVKIGGIAQWVTIRGENRSNPVILFLHGGPGSATSMLSSLFRSWEKDFTVVQWDQRGAGKTFGLNGTDEAPMTIDRMVRDGLELTHYLQTHLHKKKVILLGHSWGTELGVLMAKRDPTLFSAFVGTGFVVAKEEKEEILYARLMQRLIAAKDQDAIRELKTVGPPPYKSEHDQDVERHLQNRFNVDAERNLQSNLTPVVLFAPGVALLDIRALLNGPDYSAEALYKETLTYDARKLGPAFAMPFFIFNGDRDLTTPADLAKTYFDTVEAPQKGFVILKGGGHAAVMTMPDVFLAELKSRVRPLAKEQ